MNTYDSSQDTLAHIRRVQELLNLFASEINNRGRVHDLSKLLSPEKELFDQYTPLLKTLTYGSKEYNTSKNLMKPAIDHHVQNNSHHPEFYDNGIDGMDLLDLVEMFFDWKAATERTHNGDLLRSIDINTTRFSMSNQLASIFRNTANNMFK